MSTEHGFFGPPGARLFGSFHAGASHAGLAVLLCNPFGTDEINAHRGLRHLAQALAAAGLPTLRFDLAGCGNSAGEVLQGDRLGCWVNSVHHAIDELKVRSGAPSVALVGLRLGAALAAQAACSRSDVACLVLMAPVVNGRRWLRELRALAAATSGRAVDGPAQAAADAKADAGALESGGFVLNAPTQASVQALKLGDLRPAVARVWLLDRDDLPGHEQMAAAWQAAGVQVVHRSLPGMAAWLDEPQRSQVPRAYIEATVAALTGLESTLPRGHAPGAPLAVAAELCTPGGRLRERWVQASEACLGGVLTLPTQAPSRRLVLLLNAGAVHHIGPNGMYVPLARRLAAQGCAVLRLDLPGLGENPPRAGEAENRLYAPQAEAAVADAARWLRAELGPQPLHLVGLCAGAYHALKAAVAGVEAASVCLLNPLTYFWREGDVLNSSLPAPHVEYMAAQYYQRSLWSLQAWRKLLAGGVDLRFVTRVASGHLGLRVAGLAHRVRRAVGRGPTDDLDRELRALARRGTRMQFVFASSDPGHALLTTLGGSAVNHLQRCGMLELHFIDHADHTFTSEAPREQLLQLVERLLCPTQTTQTTQTADGSD